MVGAFAALERFEKKAEVAAAAANWAGYHLCASDRPVPFAITHITLEPLDILLRHYKSKPFLNQLHAQQRTSNFTMRVVLFALLIGLTQLETCYSAGRGLLLDARSTNQQHQVRMLNP